MSWRPKLHESLTKRQRPFKQTQAYEHERLHDPDAQIRVLTLRPAPRFKDKIECNITIWDLPADTGDDVVLDYEAVSYAWGDNTLSREAVVDGQRLAITENLDIALRYLRHTDRNRSLWIDGLCIDQSNHAEKSRQVLLLRRVFTGARHVLIWLGPGDEHTGYAMDCINRFNDLRREGRELQDVYAVPGIQEEALKKGLQTLFARPWVRN